MQYMQSFVCSKNLFIQIGRWSQYNYIGYKIALPISIRVDILQFVNRYFNGLS